MDKKKTIRISTLSQATPDDGCGAIARALHEGEGSFFAHIGFQGGIEFHRRAELWANGASEKLLPIGIRKELPVVDDIMGAEKKFERTLDGFTIAGTLDFWTSEMVTDYKTGDPKPHYPTQVRAYAWVAKLKKAQLFYVRAVRDEEDWKFEFREKGKELPPINDDGIRILIDRMKKRIIPKERIPACSICPIRKDCKLFKGGEDENISRMADLKIQGEDLKQIWNQIYDENLATLDEKAAEIKAEFEKAKEKAFKNVKVKKVIKKGDMKIFTTPSGTVTFFIRTAKNVHPNFEKNFPFKKFPQYYKIELKKMEAKKKAFVESFEQGVRFGKDKN